MVHLVGALSNPRAQLARASSVSTRPARPRQASATPTVKRMAKFDAAQRAEVVAQWCSLHSAMPLLTTSRSCLLQARICAASIPERTPSIPPNSAPQTAQALSCAGGGARNLNLLRTLATTFQRPIHVSTLIAMDASPLALAMGNADLNWVPGNARTILPAAPGPGHRPAWGMARALYGS